MSDQWHIFGDGDWRNVTHYKDFKMTARVIQGGNGMFTPLAEVEWNILQVRRGKKGGTRKFKNESKMLPQHPTIHEAKTAALNAAQAWLNLHP